MGDEMIQRRQQPKSIDEESTTTTTQDNNPSISKLFNRLKVSMALHPLRWVALFGIVVFLGVFLSQDSSNGDPLGLSTKNNKVAISPTKKKAIDYSVYENCVVHTPVSSPGEWKTKPLWFPSYPSSLDDKIVKNIISSLTGLSAGAKSYYASSRKMGLRKCFGRTETAACLLIHPMVEMSPGPETKKKSFYEEIVLILRNPATAIPSFLNGKRIKYAKLPGQTPEDEWRMKRDENLIELWNGYKKQLRAWTLDLPQYKVGAFLVYEDMHDFEKGPASLSRLAEVMDRAGFSMAPKEDLGCVWFKAIGGRNALESFEKYQYDFKDYLPGYTKQQKAFFLKELKQMVAEYKAEGFEELASILLDFHDNIETSLRLDRKWVNETASN